VREHPEPAAFLARANDVVAGEVAVGKFVTMAALVASPTGELLCGCAGHPPPRVVRASGTVDVLAAGGLALGIDAPQEYAQARTELAPGEAAVVYTDGVVEARRDGELFGEERLDAVLLAHAGEPAARIAQAVVAACRRFAGELSDDCAIVVIRRAP
jgi:sigma-B regulation protein RsbU (phosphoserine phosphatase)